MASDKDYRSEAAAQHEMKPLADKTSEDALQTKPEPFNPPSFGKIRILKTVSIFANFILMAASAQTSAALVDLASHFSVSLASISIILTVTVLSHMGGTWVGGVLYSRVNVFAMLACATLGYCLTLGTGVFMPNVFVVFAISALGAACNGAIDAVSNSHLLAMWDGERARDSLMQAMHASWSAGAMTMGATLNLFLNPDLQAHQNATLTTDCNASSLIEQSFNASLAATTLFSPTPSPPALPGSSRVQYAYLLFSCLGLIPLCLNVGIYIWDRRKLSLLQSLSEDLGNDDATPNSSGAVKKDDETNGRLTGRHALIMVVFAVLACIFDVERFSSTFLTSYLFYGLNWSTPDASVAFSVFYAGQFIARLLSVIVSAFVRPIYILLTNGSLILVSVLVLGIFGKAAFVPYVTSLFVGVGNSCSFPSLFLWLSSFTPITGLVSASLFIGNLDSLLSPVFGHLIENWWPPFFICYAITLCSVCICTLIIGHRVGLYLRASANPASASSVPSKSADLVPDDDATKDEVPKGDKEKACLN